MENSSVALTRSLQEQLDAAVSQGIPGIVAAIADSGGIRWTGSAGVAKLQTGEALRADHLFGLGSITKTFVAVVVHQLAEEGKLSLTQTPLDILGPDAVGDIPNASLATVAHLLNHTSGIPSWEDDPAWIRDGRGANTETGRIWGKTETLDYIRNSDALFTPGHYYSYANTNHTLLGMIIEQVTGNEATAEIRARVLNPIGAEDIYLEGFDEFSKTRTAPRYHHATEAFKRDAGVAADFPEIAPGIIDVSTSNLSVEWTAGGMVATLQDLVRYTLALRDGALLNEAAMARLYDWRPTLKPGDTGYSSLVGYGVFRYETSAGGWIGHGGDVLGYTANMHWHETEDLVVIVLANVGSMHSGGSVMTAYDVGRRSEFPSLALRLLKSQKDAQ